MGDKKKNKDKNDKKLSNNDNEILKEKDFDANNNNDKKYNKEGKISTDFYEDELEKLYMKLVMWQSWVKQKGEKIAIIFEGRDAAGKGGLIKRIVEPLNPRGLRVVALEKPNDREKTQWYFQRYISHLPSAGEIVIFDRSWYNRAGVEKVLGFCTDEEYMEFLRSCPDFENMIIRSGIRLIKYWISVDHEEQEKRLKERSEHPDKRWKLSEIDLISWNKWEDYSKAKDEMIKYTDTKISPWYNVDSNDKKKARLNTISHLLSMFRYENIVPPPIVFPPRKINENYKRPPVNNLTWIPEVY